MSIPQSGSSSAPSTALVSARLTSLLSGALSNTSMHALVGMLGPVAHKRVDQLTPQESQQCVERVKVTLRLYGRDATGATALVQSVANALHAPGSSSGTPAATGRASPPAAPLKTETIAITSVDDVVRARNVGKDLSRQLGFDESSGVRIATAISELARNIVLYAGSGSIELQPCAPPTSMRKGLRVQARDQGPGITNLDDILNGTYKSAHGMGMGLRGVKKLMDEFLVESTPGAGTRVTATKWLMRGP